MGSIMGLLIVTAFTIIIEAGVGLLFGFDSAKQIAVIGITNLITNGAIGLLIYRFRMSTLGEFLGMLILSLPVVFLIELTVYVLLLNRFSDMPREDDVITGGLVILYTVIANVASGIIMLIV